MEREYFPTINAVTGKKRMFGNSTVISHYHYCRDNNLVEGKCALMNIPCACVACT